MTNLTVGLTRLRALLAPDLYEKVDATRRASIVGWGTLFSVAHFVDGMVRLHEASACFAAAPLRRSAMEYGMWTVWLADQGDDAVDVMNRGLMNTQDALIKGVTKAGRIGGQLEAAIKIAEMTQQTLLATHPGETYLNFKNLLDAYDPSSDGDGQWPYRLLYDAESRFSHATLTGAQMFFEAPYDKDELTFWDSPRFQELIPCLEFGIGMLHMTMLAYNTLLVGTPWTDELKAVAEEYDLDRQVPQRRRR